MREGVPRLFGQYLPLGLQRWCRGGGVHRPFAAGPAEHSAQKPLVRPPFQKPCPIVTPHHIGDAQPRRLGFLRQFAGQVGLGSATRALQGARQGQIPQAGERGVQIVAPRSITAWA